MKKIDYHDCKNVISKQLKITRTKQKITQAELATKMQLLNVNMDQQAISKIENNRRIVTDYELACFCKILNVDERVLLKDYYFDLS